MRFLNIKSYDAEMVLNVRADCIAGWETIRDHSSEEDYALIHLISGQTVRIKGDLDETLSPALDEDWRSWHDVFALSPEGAREHEAREDERQQAARQRAAEKNAAAAKAKAERPPFRMRDLMEGERLRDRPFCLKSDDA